jgi:capsular polysaccharide transport system permease protein
MTTASQDGAAAGPPKRPDLKAVEATRAAAPAAKPAPKPAAKPKPATPAAPPPPSADRTAARAKPRHYVALFGFALFVLLPLAAVAAYLYTRAADQYHSEVAFSIRSEDPGAATAGILGALTQVSGGSASDSDILFEFILSQRMVESVEADLDLRRIYNLPEGDPVFTLGEDATIEDLISYWGRMIDMRYEASTGIINLRANAFTPDDAQAIAAAILTESSDLVNRLSEQSRSDAIRYATEDLGEAEARLTADRMRLADFRRENRIVDPSADVAGQMGLVNALSGELAQALVERDMLLSYADGGDQRVVQANRRIEAITERIEEERADLGIAGVAGAGGNLPEIIGAYEELLVDLEFSNTAYTQALGNLAVARAEARRQSRYLAAHVEPTRAERALYPRRATITAMVGLFLLLGWSVLMLVWYNVRDNR